MVLVRLRLVGLVDLDLGGGHIQSPGRQGQSHPSIMNQLCKTLIRHSHVGRRPVIFEPDRIKINPIPVKGHRPSSFQQTPIIERILARGPLGELSFPIHHGLKWSIKEGHIEAERQIVVEIDKQIYDSMTKYNQKFVKAMWGTTASGLNRIIEGVGEVCLT